MHREGIYRRIRHSHFRQVGEKLKWQVIEEMKNEKMNLLSKLKNVQEEVKTIEETEKVNDAVLEWLNDAEKLIEEVEKWVNPDLEVELYDNMLNKIKRLTMADHAKKYDSERVKRWRSALYEVSHLSGECYVNDKWTRVLVLASMETINDEQREKMSNPNNCRTRKNTTLGVSCSASSASMLRKRTCCGESLMPIMSTSLNNPRHTFWACPNWKVDEDSTEQELEEEEKILRLKRELDVERRKRKLMLCVIVSWALTFMVWLGCTRLCRFWNEKMSPVLLQ
ncbi:hypothetical protein VNO77_37248 [Canavalia gladiata]|uniref:Uncharacterized protein n=1 Tax=Canavalia gladiata TaxID=3824 RepID=A0AAN9PUP7_CANGL